MIHLKLTHNVCHVCKLVSLPTIVYPVELTTVGMYTLKYNRISSRTYNSRYAHAHSRLRCHMTVTTGYGSRTCSC